MKKLLISVICTLFAASPAAAGELFGGLYAHDVDTFLTKSGVEDGMDIQLGYRGDRIGATPFQPYAFGALNTAGDTHYAALGISAKFGDRLFVRPGVGIAVHTGSAANFDNPTNDKIEFGSRFLFEPELGVGYQLSERASLEASWVHMSHAQLFGRQNPGVDNSGARLSWKL